MNCLFVQRNLPEFLENQLTPAQTKRFLAHLNQCAACRADLVQLRALHQVLQKPVPVHASYPLQLRLKKMLETEVPPPQPSRWYQRPGVQLVYLLALLGLIWSAHPALVDLYRSHLEILAFIAVFLVVLCTALLVLLSTHLKIELKEKLK